MTVMRSHPILYKISLHDFAPCTRDFIFYWIVIVFN